MSFESFLKYELLLISMIIIVLINLNDGESSWDYGKLGPDVWSKDYSDCGGHRQSPINIQTKCTKKKSFPKIQFSPNHDEQSNLILKNSGHTIVASLNSSSLSVSGGDLQGIYRFLNFHLHWGPNENVGSEHQINGVKYTGESHFVYENDQTNEKAVFAFLMRSVQSPTKNKAMEQWKRYFDKVQNFNIKNASVGINLTFFLLFGENLSDYWRYEGSLTTPPCTENVIWTVFKNPIDIFDYDFQTFRDDLLFESYRGPQPLYNRTIYRTFDEIIVSPIPEQNCCLDQKSKANLLSFSSFFYFSIFISRFLYLTIQFHL